MCALNEQIRLSERLQEGERYTPTVPRWEIDLALGRRAMQVESLDEGVKTLKALREAAGERGGGI